MKNVLKRGIALTIAMTLSISNVNLQSFVVKAEQSTVVEESLEKKNATVDKGICEPEVVEEVVSDRTTDSTTFLLSNGMKQTTYYSDNIYFIDEKGKLSEYDSELGFDYTTNIYDYDKYDLIYSQISKIKKKSFCYPRTYFYSCNAATKDDNGKKFAKKWSKRFWSTTTAFRGKTDYSGIRDNSIFQKIFGRGLGPADLYPVADKNAKKITYTKAVIRAPQ